MCNDAYFQQFDIKSWGCMTLDFFHHCWHDTHPEFFLANCRETFSLSSKANNILIWRLFSWWPRADADIHQADFHPCSRITTLIKSLVIWPKYRFVEYFYFWIKTFISIYKKNQLAHVCMPKHETSTTWKMPIKIPKKTRWCNQIAHQLASIPRFKQSRYLNSRVI